LMIVMRGDLNVMQRRSVPETYGWAGGPAFKLQKPPQMPVLRVGEGRVRRRHTQRAV
jgi:hypothetical protein